MATTSAAANTAGTSGKAVMSAVVITGAGSGIGRATALYLAETGKYSLALVDSDSDDGKALCEELHLKHPKVDIVFAAVDLSVEENVIKLFRSFRKTFGTLHGLVNCAGINLTSDSPTHVLAGSILPKLMANNLHSALFCSTQFIAAAVSEKNPSPPPVGGYSIVNFSASRNLPKDAFNSHYVSTARAIEGLSTSLAREYGNHGLRINVVAPGIIDTPFLSKSLEDTDFSTSDVVEEVPMLRSGTAKEVAALVAFLLGPESSYITGAVIPVDGGLGA